MAWRRSAERVVQEEDDGGDALRSMLQLYITWRLLARVNSVGAGLSRARASRLRRSYENIVTVDSAERRQEKRRHCGWRRRCCYEAIYRQQVTNVIMLPQSSSLHVTSCGACWAAVAASEEAVV